MASFLFVVPPLAGHVNPTVALGAELRRRGHEVAWAGMRAAVGPLLEPGATLVPVAEEVPDETVTALAQRSAGLRGAAALEFLWRDFLHPLALAMAPGIERAVAALRPDALVVDQQAFAGAVVARRAGLPWATSATTSAELVDPFQGLPKVGEWVRRQLVELQVDLGVDPAAAVRGDLRFSEHLVLAYTTEALAGPVLGLPAGAGPVAMVGPALGPRSDGDLARFPWSWLAGGGPVVLVTLGTVNAQAGGRFFATAVEALSGTGIRTVLVAPPELVGDVPADVLVLPHVPQVALLERVDAVVCHGGHNTVCEALVAGVPLVVAPIRDDQPIVADQVVRCGAGLRVRFGRVTAAELRAAVAQVLHEPAYREAAAVVQRSFALAGGAPAAAGHLEAMLTRGGGARRRSPGPGREPGASGCPGDPGGAR